MTGSEPMVEQAGDGTGTAAVFGQHTVLGTGDTREATLEDLNSGFGSLLKFLEREGRPLPEGRYYALFNGNVSGAGHTSISGPLFFTLPTAGLQDAVCISSES